MIRTINFIISNNKAIIVDVPQLRLPVNTE